MGMLEELYRADSKRLNVMVAGQPGSGKSFFIEHTLKDYLSKSRLKNERFVYITPKGETILDLDITPLHKLDKALRKERLVVIAPDLETLEDDVDDTNAYIFNLRDANEDLTATIIIDDSQVFLKNQGNVSPELRRLTLTCLL